MNNCRKLYRLLKVSGGNSARDDTKWLQYEICKQEDAWEMIHYYVLIINTFLKSIGHSVTNNKDNNSYY